MTGSIERAVLARIALADDFTAGRVFKIFHDFLATRFPRPTSELEASLPENLKNVDGTGVGEFFEQRADAQLGYSESVGVARRLLVLAAGDAAAAPVLNDAFDAYADDKQMVGEILAIGIVGAVWMTIASMSFSFRTGSGEIKKSETSSALVKSFAEVVRALRSAAK
jgi:hypothetical protein